MVEAFAATVSYRLEPGGWGTRFPLVLDALLAGLLNPAQADDTLAELDLIAAELRNVPVDRVVFSLSDLSRRDEPNARLNRAAKNACELFIADDGRPLVSALRDGVLASKLSGRPLALSTPRAAAKRREALALVALGLAITGVFSMWLPHVVLRPLGASGASHGPAAWSIGILAAMAGVVRLLAIERPAFAQALRRRGLIALAIGTVVTGTLFALSWR